MTVVPSEKHKDFNVSVKLALVCVSVKEVIICEHFRDVVDYKSTFQ